MMNIIHTYIAEKATSGKEEVRGGGKERDENKEYGFQQNVLESRSERKEEDNDKDALFDIKIGTITEGLLPCYAKRLSQLPHDNALSIVNFIMSLNTELNPSINYRMDHINVLCCLSKFYNNQKKFDDVTREDVLVFLDSYRKPKHLIH